MNEEPAPRPTRRLSAAARRRRVPFVGPLFGWELVRLARRGQDARARTLLALVLFVTLLLFTLLWFGIGNVGDLYFGTGQEQSISESARFAEQFTLSLLMAQLAVMCLLAPAYAAGCIAEEKERKTWQYLLTTDLSNREIILGKFCGRVVFLLGVMFAGLPVLALTGLVGGVDPAFLIFGYLFTGCTVVLVSAIGVASAVFTSNFRGAMFRSYGTTALYVFFGGVYPLFSPFLTLLALYSTINDGYDYVLTLGTLYMAVQLGLAAFLLFKCVRRVRKKDRRPPPRRDDFDEPRRALIDADGRPLPVARPVRRETDENRWGETETRRRRHTAPEWADKPRIADTDPFLWKETYTSGSRRTEDDDSIRSLMIVVGVLVALVLVFVLLIALMTSAVTSDGGALLSSSLTIAGIMGVFIHLLTLGPAACGAVIREKARLTLEPLLTIPVPRTRILGPKWRVAFTRGWWWGGPGAVAVVLGALASESPYVALPLAVYLPAAAALAVSFGLWLSTRCKTILRAILIFMLLAGALTLAPLVVRWLYDVEDQRTATVLLAALAVVNAAAAWQFWRMSVKEFEEYGRN